MEVIREFLCHKMWRQPICGFIAARTFYHYRLRMLRYCRHLDSTSDQVEPWPLLPFVADNPTSTSAQPPLCRLGVNGEIAGVDTSPLRISWYQDYDATRNGTPPNDVKHIPMIRLTQTGPDSYTFSILSGWVPANEAQLKDLIAKRPGSYWFIGNEPDRPRY